MAAYLGRPVSGETFEHGVAIWSSESWIAGATAWVDERLAEAGLTRTGDMEQRSLRPWASAWNFLGHGGDVRFYDCGETASWHTRSPACSRSAGCRWRTPSGCGSGTPT
jgi:hypothetical protein